MDNLVVVLEDLVIHSVQTGAQVVDGPISGTLPHPHDLQVRLRRQTVWLEAPVPFPAAARRYSNYSRDVVSIIHAYNINNGLQYKPYNITQEWTDR